MVHRALLGSVERFIGLLIENYMGALPVWVAPIQSVIVPVSDKVLEYARSVYEKLLQQGIRVELDASKETVSYKIRHHITQKVPYIIVVGEREASAGTVAVRVRGKKKQEVMSVEDFIKYIKEKIENKSVEF